jgi:hypothetical protein
MLPSLPDCLMDTTGIRYRCAWLVHALGVRHNPLRRTVDRCTAAVLALLLAVGLAAIPACAVFGSSFRDRQLRAEATEAAQRYPVVATLTGPPRVHATGDAEYGRDSVAEAPMRWSDRIGREHSAMVTVPAVAIQQNTATVWVEGSGKLAAAPRSTAEVVASAVVVAMGLLLATEVSLVVLAAGVRRLSDLYARHAWTHEWEAVAQRGTWPRH